MDHDDDVRAALERDRVAGLLVAAVAKVAVVLDVMEAELARERDGLVLARVVDEDDLVDDLVRELVVGALEGPRRVVRGHDDHELPAVDHGRMVAGEACVVNGETVGCRPT